MASFQLAFAKHPSTNLGPFSGDPSRKPRTGSALRLVQREWGFCAHLLLIWVVSKLLTFCLGKQLQWLFHPLWFPGRLRHKGFLQACNSMRRRLKRRSLFLGPSGSRSTLAKKVHERFASRWNCASRWIDGSDSALPAHTTGSGAQAGPT